MRKRLITTDADQVAQPEGGWLDLDRLAQVEISSEDEQHPIEGALLPDSASGWRASAPGEQVIRLLFPDPQHVRRIWVEFVEPDTERTQEYVLRWSRGAAQPLQEVVRQRWNFSPSGSTREAEDHNVDLPAASVLELAITPDVSGGPARATLARLRLG